MPLKKIPNVISPDLLHVLAQMGHGDDIVFADAHFPSNSVAKAQGAILVRCDGLSIPPLLEGVLELFPLDPYVAQPAGVMDPVPSDKEKGIKVPVWDKYQEIINKAEGKEISFEKIERFEFYERAKKAFAVVHTGETAIYGNLILKKGLAL
ncbi:hypothetical protein LOTGIDRAFT_201494 [Lottia gigantea]|uniref:L-fucose mutarotase n=1 Tax=Lottia gigantea TaxID=225164 RepID=V4A534_LOTGI|nr:hypothetical protein LOTGIDRAFT_201494 [Lottia gigantea]ESO99013.1 hypothetical protein LOTGIDRAFT_201494 [Lottia gigantea]